MKRRLFTLLSALSLPLCVGTCVLWVQSYSRTTENEFKRNGTRWSLIWARGRFVLSNEIQRQALYRELEAIDDEDKLAQENGNHPEVDYSIFETMCVVGQQIGSFVLVERKCPCIVPSAAFAVLPTIWGSLYLKKYLTNRRLHGCCRACGYDLRATPGRCPECGALVPATTGK